jgi:hypothetical protein
MTHRFTPFGICLLAAVAASGTLPASAAAPTPEQAYRRDAAACVSRPTEEGRSDCLYEARSVRRDALAGLVAPALSQKELAANALLRCQRQRAEERADCERMVQGAGTREGSVAEGGVSMELVTRTVGVVPAAAAAPR